jgi:hypothetical protein
VLHTTLLPILDQEPLIQIGHPSLGGVPTVLGKDGQLHPLIPHLKNPLLVVVWVTEVVYLYKYYHILHCVPILDFLGGSKWE